MLLTVVLVFGTIYAPSLPDWVILPAVVILLAITIVLTLVMLKKASPKATVVLDETGFYVQFDEQNFYTPVSFGIRRNELVNFYVNELNGAVSLCFKTTVKPEQFYLSAAGRSLEEKASFASLMEAFQKKVDESNHVAAVGKTAITSKTMYETWWARVLSVIVVIMLVAFTALKLFSDAATGVSWLRLVVLVFLSAPFLLKVYSGFKKK